jgi:hypothetical protein
MSYEDLGSLLEIAYDALVHGNLRYLGEELDLCDEELARLTEVVYEYLDDEV